MKITKVTQDDRQTRATIPSEYVDEFKVTKRNAIGWSIDESRKRLIGTLLTEKELEQIKKEEQE